MKKYLIVTFSLFILLHINTYAQEIEFTSVNNIEEACSLAKKENKLLFIDCSTDWCGHCKVMEKTVFTHPEVANFYNEHFICIKVNPDKKEWESIKETYPIHAYPTYLFINDKGQLQHMKVSGTAARDFIKVGEKALSETNMLWYKNKMEMGDHSLTTTYGYYKSNVYDKGKEKVVNEILKNSSDDELYSKEAWSLITKGISYRDSIFNNFILKNYSKYYSAVGEKEVVDFIENELSFSVWRWGKKTQQAKAAEKLAVNVHPLAKRSVSAGLVKSFAEDFNKKPNSKNKEALIKSCADYLDYEYLNWKKLQEAARSVLNTFDKHQDYELMNKAILWIDNSIKVKLTQSNLYYKARLLEEIGKNEEAIISAKKAKETAILGKTYIANYISIDYLDKYILELRSKQT